MHYDLVVIGGGINGAGMARDAALRGLKVCLIEKRDFASGTSSKSSKLIHGGLRYLEQGDFKLVYEALHERHTLLTIAPHLVQPLPFLLPFFRGERRRPWRIRLGLALYDLLAGSKGIRRHQMLSLDRLQGLQSGLDDERLLSGALFFDAQMNDARLCLENILSAEEAGAHCHNYMRFMGLDFASVATSGDYQIRCQDEITKQELTFTAPTVVNTTGPWSDEVRKQALGLESVGRFTKQLRPTKGIHCVVPNFLRGQGILTFTGSDDRAFFILPWGEWTLLGTTDTDYSGDLDRVHATREEVQYLLSEANRVFPKVQLTLDQVLMTFAGLRPLGLPSKARTAGQTSREHRIFEERPGFFSLIGGKYTTYRKVAEEMVDRVIGHLAKRDPGRGPGRKPTFSPCQTAEKPLYGGMGGTFWEDFTEAQLIALRQEAGIGPVSLYHILSTYGSQFERVLKLARQHKELRGRLCPHHPHLKAELADAFLHESAQNLADFFFRRSWMAYSICRGEDAWPHVEETTLGFLGWSREHLQEAWRHYLTSLTAERSFQSAAK